MRPSVIPVIAAAGLLLAGGARGATDPAAEPYFQLRQQALGYHGTAEDLAGLTELRLGWFGPSDPADPLHGDAWWAAGLAVEEANAAARAAGSDAFAALPVRLLPCWTADPWGSGVSSLARLVYNEQPLALLGSIDSATTHLAEQVVAKANLPLVSPVATDKTVTLAGVSWMFSCAPDDAAVARALVDDVLHTAGAHPAVLLLTTTDHESRMTAREVARELARRGVAPAFRFDLTPGNPDATAALAAAGTPGAVIVIAGAADSAQLVRAVRERLGPVPVHGGPAVTRQRFLELAGPAAEGVRGPLLYVAAADDFAARFAAARGHAPDYTAALTYDATRLLIAAIRHAGPNRARIREALAQPAPWPGVAGPVDFDGTGRNRRTALRCGTVRDGRLVADPLPATALTLR